MVIEKKKGELVSERAFKHINELAQLAVEGSIRPLLCFVIQRTDSKSFQASNLDPIYKDAFNQAKSKGVEIFVLVVKWTENGEAYFVCDNLKIND